MYISTGAGSELGDEAIAKIVEGMKRPLREGRVGDAVKQGVVDIGLALAKKPAVKQTEMPMKKSAVKQAAVPMKSSSSQPQESHNEGSSSEVGWAVFLVFGIMLVVVGLLIHQSW